MLNTPAAYVVYAVVLGGIAGIALYVAGAFLGALPAGTVSALICVVIGSVVVSASFLAHRERVNVAVTEWRNARRR